tara:strand:+ start:307 stop:744 length:438 start_codon:yes stop_codon:yes gene_type:complete
MAYKLGRGKKIYARNGEIKSKLRFKKDDPSIPGTPIIRKDLGPNIGGEANADGSIFLNSNIQPGSIKERMVLRHEMIHCKDMKISPNKLSYGDDHVRYNGQTYPRKTINGQDMILDITKGEWKHAGAEDFPWEIDANTMSGQYKI